MTFHFSPMFLTSPVFRVFLLVVLLFSFSRVARGQEYPPRPLTAYAYQNLSFGAFCQTFSGGTVSIFPNGMRSVTGGIVEVNQGYSYYPAIFEIDANPGTLVQVVLGPDVSLTGSNGGSLNLHLFATYPVAPFVTTAVPPSRTQVSIGGTLTIGTPLSNPPGYYSGTFMVTFIQQ
jgi:hypothetical protein